MQRFLTIVWAVALASGLSAAALAQGPIQAPSPEAKRAIEQARKKHPNLSVRINSRTGLPSTVTGLNPGTNVASQAAAPASEPSKQEIADAVTAWFAKGELSGAFGTQNSKAHYLCTGPEHVFHDKDVPGQYVAEVVQEVDIEGHPAVPVFGAHGKVAMDRSLAPRQITMNASQVAISSAPPRIDEAAAIEAARAKLQELVDAGSNNPFAARLPNPRTAQATVRLVVFDPALIKSKGEVSGPTRLAWLVSIGTLRAFVDATTRDVFMHYNDQPSAGLRRVFDLAGSTTFPGTLARSELDEQRPSSVHMDAEDAYNHAGVVRDFFKQLFGRKGHDDSVSHPTSSPRGGLDSYVRYGMEKNAWWCVRAGVGCPQPDIMVYGPGFAAALDIVGHEITHGVIRYEADLLYLHEPGAVNEALADIFGTLIEFHARGGAGNWTIGESLPGRSAALPLRDMANPHLASVAGASLFDRDRSYDARMNFGQPDYWTEYVRTTDPICRSLRLQDNGCVHFNSGILNKFAYLVSEGGTHYGVTVAGIGRDKLGRLAYRTLTHYLHSTSGLQDAAEAFTLSCADLSRASPASMSANDCAQVQKAREAVGLDVPTG